MAKKKETKKVELKEVSRVEINGNIIITYEDGSVKIIPAPIMLTADQASEIFGSEEDEEEEDEDEDDSDEDEEEEDEEEEDEDEDDSDEDEDDDDSDEDEDDDDSEEEEDEEEEEEELTGEALAEMDFEELEDVCDDKDLDTDPDDFDEEDIEKLRKAIAKELGIKLPAKKEAKGKGKKGKK
nr:MAG: hypothetical protein [Bacteriophage sp.]